MIAVFIWFDRSIENVSVHVIRRFLDSHPMDKHHRGFARNDKDNWE